MKDLPTSILSSAEINTISGRIVDVCMEVDSDNPYVKTLCSNISKSNSELSRSLGKTLSSEYTAQLIILDQDRDHSFIGFGDFVSAFTHSHNEVKKAAAMILAPIFENAGKLYVLGYGVETSKMNSLILNLITPQAVQAIETIGAGDWFEQLTSAQEAFEKLHKSKVEADAAMNYLTVRDSRVIIERYLGALLNYIGTNSDLKDAKYEAIKDKINVLITDTVAIARSRISRKENDEKDKPVS